MNTRLLSRTLPLLIAISVAAGSLVSPAVAQVASWDFTGLSSPATATATSSNPQLASVPVLTRGPGAPASSGSNSFRTTGFQNNGIATSNTDYFEFTVQAAVGQQVSIASISANLVGTSTFSASPGVSNQFAYSLDGTNFTLIDSPSIRIGNGSIGPISTSGITALQNVPAGTTITFRFYASGQTTTGGWGFNGATGLAVDGTVTSAAAGAPSITSAATASGTGYEAFSYQITASNSPTSYDAIGLPTGLSVNSATGEISGTPTVPGNYTVTISATNAEGTGSAQLSLGIAKNPLAPTITSVLTATGLVGDPFTYQIVADNTPTSYSSGALPEGLTLNTSTGEISGTPTTGGVSNVSITASNALGQDTRTLAITINGPPVITSAVSGSLYTTNSFSYTITASGTPTSFGAAGLPAGWTVDSATGLVSSGVEPLVAGTITFEVSATNAFGTGIATYTLAVFDQAAQDAVPLNVVVNKYVNATPDKVQLLVVGNGTPGSTVDMRGMIIKDFSGSNANDGGGKYVFADNPLWSAVKAGTLVTLSAGTTQSEDLDPADFYLAVNLGSETFFNFGGGSFDIATTDMLMIKAAGSGVSGVAGGIHALIGGSAGAQGTAYTGAKLRTTGTSGTNLGVMALNSTSQLSDFGAAGQPESTDAQGGVAVASLNFTTWNNATNGNFVLALRGVVDGTGTAVVLNATGGSPFVGQNLFGRNLPAQTIEIVYTPVSSATPMSSITIEVPSAFGAPLPANVSVSGTGAESATVGVVGQVVTVSGLAAINPNAVTVAISGLSTPETATPVTNSGGYSFAMQSQGQGGSLVALAVSPTARVLIPIANVRNADPTTFVPVLLGQTVAVEGVCSVGRLGTGNTSSALQDATHGVTIFSQTAVAGPQNRGNRYAVVGAVAQFNGLVQLNLTDPNLVFDLGLEGDPSPVTVSVTEFNTNGLVYQSRVIRIEDLSYVSGTWAVGQNVILQDSSANQVTARIQSASTAGQPTYPVTLTGIGGQFDNSAPFDTGFQIQPRDQADAPADPATITSSLTASAVQGTPFTYQITATDNPPPTSYNASPLPAGLSVDGLTGLISGTPTESGSFNVGISATNGGGTTTETLVLTISGASGYDTWAGSFGLDPAVTTGPTAGAPAADPDGDSFNNSQEYAFGTNPTQGTPSLLSTGTASGDLTVTWLERADVTYNVQSTVNLATTPFANDGTVTVVAGPTDPAPPAGYTRKQFTVPASGQNFYRVSATVPAP